MAEFEIGAAREETVAVGNDNAITFLGPDGPRVLSTPHMIGLMERTCRNLVLSMLQPGQDTVGTHVNVSHCAAAPIGSTVVFRASLSSVEKRRVNFDVTATMGEKRIGEGTHQRAVIEVSDFKTKVQQPASPVQSSPNV